MLSGLGKSLIVSQLVLCGISSAVVADQTKWRLSKVSDTARWRLFEERDAALLAIADTDEGTDAFGSPLFRCKKASGPIEAEGATNDDIRTAMAAMISSDKYPLIQLFPEARDNVSLLSLSYSEADEGWRFHFLLEAVGPTFEEFKRTGQLAFKAGTKVIRAEIKAGIENAARFQDICKRPPK
jgi:hypothetical protein